MRSLLRTQLRLGLSVLAVVLRRSWAGCRCSSRSPGSRAWSPPWPRHAGALAAARGPGLPGAARRGLVARPAGRAHRGATSPTSSTGVTRSSDGTAGCSHVGAARLAAVVAVVWSLATLGGRRGRAAAVPHHQSTSTSPRRAVSPRWNASAIGGEYLSAACFLGVAGLVLASGADMLWYPVGYTAGYLVLLRARRRPAAPVRRLHAAGLRRGPAAAPGRCADGLRAAGARDRLALPAAAVPGRRAGPARRDRRAGLGRRLRRRGGRGAERGRRAGCARSPSCRRSSTGSS